MPTHGSAILRMLPLGEPLTDERKLKLAAFVLQVHDPIYKRPVFPERPEILLLEDHDLIDAYRQWSHGLNLGTDKRRQLMYFGTWRAAVMAAEMKSGIHLTTVLDAAVIYDHASLPDEADVLFTFAEDQFSIRRSEVPRDGSWLGLRDWSLVAARDLNVLPGYMRTMKMPRGGVPTHRPQGQRGPDSNVAGQGSLWGEQEG